MKVHKTYKAMWNHLHNQLSEQSKDMYKEDLPYIDLFVAIIIDGASCGDDDYFKSKLFELHCKHLCLDKDYVYDKMRRAQDIVMSGLPWELTIIEENDYEI